MCGECERRKLKFRTLQSYVYASLLRETPTQAHGWYIRVEVFVCVRARRALSERHPLRMFLSSSERESGRTHGNVDVYALYTMTVGESARW